MADTQNPLSDVPSNLVRDGAIRAQRRVEMLRELPASETEIAEAAEIADRIGAEAASRPAPYETEDEFAALTSGRGRLPVFVIATGMLVVFLALGAVVWGIMG
jgi:hypothetical protein